MKKLPLTKNSLLKYLQAQILAKGLIQDQLDEEIKRLEKRIKDLRA